MANYRVPVLENFAWQEPVADELLNPTGLTPSKGDRYLINGVGAGTWVGHDNQIAWYDGSAWLFDTPGEGWRCFVQDLDRLFYYDGASWTDQLIVGDLTIHGDIDTPNQSDWTLKDNVADALTFITNGMVGDLLNFDTTDGAEVLSTDAIFEANGIVDINNDITLETQATAIDLKQNESSAISFDTTSLAGILSIDTTSGSERVKMANDCLIVGDLIVQGTTTTIETNQMTIEDKIITLNKGGAASSANDSGLEFEENGVVVGYIKTTADRGGYLLQAPANNYDLTIDINATETIIVSGSLDIEADSAINQDVTTDASVTFDNVTLTGINSDSINATTNPLDFDLVANNASALSFDSNIVTGLININTSEGSEAVTFSRDLGTPGASDWDLVANNASALSFDSTALAGILEIDTTTGAEKVNFSGGIRVSGDITTPNASDWDLVDNNAMALSFDAPGKEGMLVFDTRDGAEKLISSTGVDVGGDITWTSGGAISSNGTDLTLTDNSEHHVTVAESQKAYDSRARYDTTLGLVIFDQAALDTI